MTNDDNEVDWDAINERENIPYYSLTMDTAYELIEFVYDVYVSDEGQDGIPSYIKELIAEMGPKRQRTKYKYIAAFEWGGIILFNRVSNKNYY